MLRWLGFGKKTPVTTASEPKNILVSGDAIVKVLDHLKKTSEKYRQNVSTWEAMAIELESKIPIPRRHAIKEHNESLLKEIGEFIISLHLLFEPASMKFQHLLIDAHQSLHGLKQKFKATCEKLEAEKFIITRVEQDLLKLQILRLGVAIWDELIKLEVNVSSLIRNSLKLQKLEEDGVNLAAHLLFALILTSVGNFEDMSRINICWEDIYRNYLFNALGGGKKLDLMEMNFEGLLAHGEFLVKQNTLQNKHRYFTPEINIRTVTDENQGLHRTVSLPSFN